MSTRGEKKVTNTKSLGKLIKLVNVWTNGKKRNEMKVNEYHKLEEISWRENKFVSRVVKSCWTVMTFRTVEISKSSCATWSSIEVDTQHTKATTPQNVECATAVRHRIPWRVWLSSNNTKQPHSSKYDAMFGKMRLVVSNGNLGTFFWIRCHCTNPAFVVQPSPSLLL